MPIPVAVILFDRFIPDEIKFPDAGKLFYC